MTHTFTVRDGYDRHKNPRMLTVRYATLADARKLTRGNTFLFHAMDGTARKCRVTGQPKTWKTRPNDLRIPCKYGMYESHYVEFKDGEMTGSSTRMLMEVIEDDPVEMHRSDNDPIIRPKGDAE